MAKNMVFDDKARQPLLNGVSKLARAVRSTLGPRGRNAVLDKGWGSPKITKDGVTVAEDIELDDPNENLGAQLVKEAASKTNDVAGDGTTTATVLAEAIFREGLKMVAAGGDPMALARGISKATDAVSEAIRKLADKIDDKSKKAIKQIATIAGNNDPSIGDVLSEAFMKVGKDGVITVEEGKSSETYVEVVKGMQFDRGFLSPHFVTDQDNQVVELDNCQILLFEEKISSAKKLVPVLEAISKAGKPILIIAEDVEGEALATLVVNKMRGIVNCCAVKAPGYGDRRKAMIGDIGVLTGATPIFKDLGVDLESVKISDLGRAKKVTVSADLTTIVGGAGKKDEIEGRANQIRAQIDTTDSDYDREKLQERLAKLAGGVAQINCGAATETEMKERKALFEDAKAATQAALEEGIVPGGGVALIRSENSLKKVEAEGDEALGVEIIRNILDKPLRYIAENAGKDGAVIVNQVRSLKPKTQGYGRLDKIYQTGLANGMKGLRKLTPEEVKQKEPHVQSVEAIWVPQAGIIHYRTVTEKYLDIIQERGAAAFFGQKVVNLVLKKQETVVVTEQQEIKTRLAINCAGLYSDKITALTMPEINIRILPFRGEYYELTPEKQHLVNNLIYPVPNPNFPFLGVHYTRMIKGGIEAGPNAVLAFKREGYSRWDFNAKELWETLSYSGFQKLAGKHWQDGLGEMHRSYSKKAFVKALQHLIPEVGEQDLKRGNSGVRAMACAPDGTLIDDFLIMEKPGVINLCNAPSPAATANLAIGEMLAKRALERLTNLVTNP